MPVDSRTVAAVTSSTPGGDSYVYVIGSVGSTRVKIGTSVSPEKRLGMLSSASSAQSPSRRKGTAKKRRRLRSGAPRAKTWTA